MKLSITIISVFVLLSACVPINKNPKYLFSDGFYQVKTGKQQQKAYVHITQDEIRQYNIIKAAVVDTSHYIIISVRDSLGGKPVNYAFTKYSFDIDLISIPLKFPTIR